MVEKALEKFPLVINWGGDHSIALSTVSAFGSTYKDGYVIWIDAHADLNLPEVSLTGNLHGMPMSYVLGLNPNHKQTLRPEQLIYVGLRALDAFEVETIRRLGIQSFDMEYIRNHGISQVLKEILQIVGQQPVHVSFDVDSIDPSVAPSTGVREEDGLTQQEVNHLGYTLAQRTKIKSVDVVEVNPNIGSSGEVMSTYWAAFQFLQNFIMPFQRGKYDRDNSTMERSLSTATSGGFQIPTENYL